MSAAGRLGRLLGRRLRQVGEGFAEGARLAKMTYRREIAAEARRRSAPSTAAEIDPVLAGYYANLEVAPGADLETLTRAWKKLVVDFHPDRHAGNPARQAAATRLVQDLNHAYRELVAHLGKSPAGEPRLAGKSQPAKKPRK